MEHILRVSKNIAEEAAVKYAGCILWRGKFRETFRTTRERKHEKLHATSDVYGLKNEFCENYKLSVDDKNDGYKLDNHT